MTGDEGQGLSATQFFYCPNFFHSLLARAGKGLRAAVESDRNQLKTQILSQECR
jgi:hypothetical protein